MKINIIAAVAENNVIGKDNDLIWHLPADMRYFKEKTSGHCVITGRKNYESIPEKYRPLPNRTNIIITRQSNYEAPGALIVNSINDALKKAKELNNDEVYIIGGAEIYKQCIDLADSLFITEVHQSFKGDVSFPNINKGIWEKTKERHCTADEKNKYAYTFVEYKKSAIFDSSKQEN